MTTFAGTDQINIRRFLSRFVKQCDVKQILEVQTRLIISSFLKGKSCDHFLAVRNASFYTGLCYWQQYVKKTFLSYGTTTAVQNENLRFKDLKQFLHKTEVEFSSWINEKAYWCCNAFPLENKICTFIFGLQTTMQTISAHKTEEPDDKIRPSENVIQIARKKGEAYRARFSKPIVKRKVSYVSPRSEQNEDHAFMMFRKRIDHACRGPQMQVMPSPRIPGLSKKNVASFLDGLTNCCRTKNTLQPKTLLFINVMLTDTFCQTIDCFMGVGKRLSQPLEVSWWLNKDEFLDTRCK